MIYWKNDGVTEYNVVSFDYHVKEPPDDPVYDTRSLQVLCGISSLSVQEGFTFYFSMEIKNLKYDTNTMPFNYNIGIHCKE